MAVVRGTLVPVIGLVQVGVQARADRFTYIPLIGLFIIIAWGIPELLRGWRYRKEALILSSALSLSCLSMATWIQVGYWRNDITLFGHALKVTDRNVIAYNKRGYAYGSLGNYSQAMEDLSKAIELDPKYAMAYNNRGNAYLSLGNHRQAMEELKTAARLGHENAQRFLRGQGIGW